MAEAVDGWTHGARYEAFMGRWSRRVAAAFVPWVAPRPGLRWLDVGSGTGALSATILALAAPSQVIGIDASRAYVTDASRRTMDPRVRFEVRDASDPVDGERVDVAVSGLMLNFVENPAAIVEAMQQAVTLGGCVGAYVWDYQRMELLGHFWAAAVALDPAARLRDEAVRFAQWDGGHLSALWRGAGLVDVGTTAWNITCELRDFDDYWQPFTGGQGPAAAYLQSLDDRDRAALRDAVRVRVSADRPLRLHATAWGVRGTRRTDV